MAHIEAEDLIRDLKIVSENIPFKKALEKLIRSHNFSLKEVKDSGVNTYTFSRNHTNKLMSDVVSLCDKYNIDKNVAYNYLSFEKSVISKLEFIERKPFNNLVNFYNDNVRFALYADTCKKAFDTMNDQVIHFLNENAELFPESTKKFIKSKNEKISNNPNIKLKLLKNDFEAKIFSNSLSSEPDTVFIKRYMSFLKNDGSLYNFDTVLSLIYFLKALDLKYPGYNKSLEKARKSLFVNILQGFGNLFDYWLYNSDEKQFFVVLDQILAIEDLVDYFFDRLSSGDRVNKLAQFFSKYAVSDIQKEAANKILINSLKKDMNSNVLTFDDCPEDLQNQLFVEFCKKDFNYNYLEINKNLKNFSS